MNGLIPPTLEEATASVPPPLPLAPSKVPPPLPPPRRPAVWPALTIGAGATLAGIVFSVIAVIIYTLIAVGPETLMREEDSPLDMQKVLASTSGLLVTVLPGQLTFLLAALAAAAFSRRSWAQQLGLGWGSLPLWALPLLAIGTPFVGFLGAAISNLLIPAPSEQMQLITEMMRTHAGESILLPVLLFGILPPLAEETLFRGYVQRRLLFRWPPAAAIGVSSLFFVVAHMEPAHMLSILPLGVWLGIVAWRSGSILPAILCHAAQNLLATTGAVYSEPTVTGIQWADPSLYGFVAVTGAAFAASVWALRRAGRSRSSLEAGPSLAVTACGESRVAGSPQG